MFEISEQGREFVNGAVFGKRLREFGVSLVRSKLSEEDGTKMLILRTAWSAITGDFDGGPTRDQFDALFAFARDHADELRKMAERAMAISMN